MPITTNVASSNPAHFDVYSIQHFVIKLVSDLRHVGRFLRIHRFSPSINTDHYDITEILLKVVLNTITVVPNPRLIPIYKCSINRARYPVTMNTGIGKLCLVYIITFNLCLLCRNSRDHNIISGLP